MRNSEEEERNRRREAEHQRQLEKERVQEQRRQETLLDAKLREYKQRAMTPGEKIDEEIRNVIISIVLLLLLFYAVYWLVMNVRC